MWPFKTKKPKNEVKGVWYNQLSSWCAVAGCQINGYLQRKTKSWSPLQLRMACLIFVLVAGGSSVWVFIEALGHPSEVMRITPINVPPAVTSPGAESLPYDARTRISIERIRVFHHLMDSLKNDPSGRRVFDSLRQARPGLFDSIDRVEQLYAPHEKRNHILNN